MTEQKALVPASSSSDPTATAVRPPNTVESSGNTIIPGQVDDHEPQQQQQVQKVDPITALQDGIDSLSLSMFEALRGLRDAVAPESGNLAEAQGGTGGGGGPATTATTMTASNHGLDSYEDFWHAYKNGDPDVVALVQRVSGPNNPPTKTQDYVRIHSRLEMEKDAVLVSKLARTVLEKSAVIDDRVSSLPGINRTKQQQEEYIQLLLQKTNEVDERLAVAYRRAGEQLESTRKFIMDHTSIALDIDEEDHDTKTTEAAASSPLSPSDA